MSEDISGKIMSWLWHRISLRRQPEAQETSLRTGIRDRIRISIHLGDARALHASFDCRVVWFESRRKRNFISFETTDELLIGIDLTKLRRSNGQRRTWTRPSQRRLLATTSRWGSETDRRCSVRCSPRAILIGRSGARKGVALGGASKDRPREVRSWHAETSRPSCFASGLQSLADIPAALRQFAFVPITDI
jgi:hypothetical protein